MKTRMSSVFILLVALALLTLAAARGETWSVKREAWSEQLTPYASPSTKPAGVDLDVTYISRTPLHNRYEVWYTTDGKPYLAPGTEDDQRWPDHGEVVTFTAHIINKGTMASDSFAFQWLIDGVEVYSGTHPSLEPGEEGTETVQWEWAHTVVSECLQGQHTVGFVVDPEDEIAETHESNNRLEDRTDALSLVLAVTPELYIALETPVDPQWPFSAEDWLQKQIAAMNAAFAHSIYPSAPNGIEERVRLDKILHTSSAPPIGSEDGGFFMSGDDRSVPTRLLTVYAGQSARRDRQRPRGQCGDKWDRDCSAAQSPGGGPGVHPHRPHPDR